MVQQTRFNVADAHDIQRVAQDAAVVLKKGGIVLYPTDTVYGLGSDSIDDEVIGRVHNIKDRITPKPMLVLVSNMDMAEEYAMWDDVTKKIATAFWPGPLTILVQKTPELSGFLTAGSSHVGMRMPNHDFSRALIEAFGRPITSTSANISGRKQASTFNGILEDLSTHHDMLSLAIEEEGREGGALLPSTVVAVEGGQIKILREGLITKEQLSAIL
jgi:L-threonylcarbamoyladenylate synthase